MKLYLQTANPQQFFEINQYLPLDGVLFDAKQAIRENLNPSQVLPVFLEYFSKEQKLLVPVISGGFRNQLEEIKSLRKLSDQLVFRLLSRPDGLMCQKACKTLRFPCMLEGIDSCGQLLLAISTGQPLLIPLSTEESFSFNLKELLQGVQSLNPEEKSRIICYDIKQNEELLMAMQAGLSSFALDYKTLNELLYPAASGSLQQHLKEEWLIRFSLTTFAEEPPKTQELTD